MVRSHEQVAEVVRSFIARVRPETSPDIDVDTPLYTGGVHLDSLETAELSALLEDEFGDDPFLADTMPQTLNDILAFYATVAAKA